MIRYILFALFAGALLFTASGCGDDGSPSTTTTGTGGGDTTPPTVSSVTAVDANTLNVVFSEDVDRATAEFRNNYLIIEGTPRLAPGAPGDTVHVGTASLGSDDRTVTLFTTTSMTTVDYDLTVSGVRDVAGNEVSGSGGSESFTGSNAGDTTPPTLTSRSPGPGAIGVQLAQPVIVTFSEPMAFTETAGAFTWTYNAGANSVAFEVASENPTQFFVSPLSQLPANTQFNVQISTAAEDFAGNSFAGASWNFTTTNTVDTTPPTLVSSTPADGATNVDTDVTLQLAFSEPINQTQLNILLTPDIEDGVLSFTNNGATLNFDPSMDLEDNTQYNILIPSGGIVDLAGNTNASNISVTFSTGMMLASGSISGTLSGHPGTQSSNPSGATVAAVLDNPITSEDEPNIVGQATADVSGNYTISNVPDGTYYLLSVLDSNNDGRLDPEEGDGYGLLGANLESDTLNLSTVTVNMGSDETNADFRLYDFSAVAGSVSYIGTNVDPTGLSWILGVFDTTGFDLAGAMTPVAEDQGFFPGNVTYAANGFDGDIVDGVYYVGAFIDANSNGFFDSSDPVGVYGGVSSPTPISLSNGSDALGIDIMIDDPASRIAFGWNRSPIDNQYRSWIRRVSNRLR